VDQVGLVIQHHGVEVSEAFLIFEGRGGEGIDSGAMAVGPDDVAVHVDFLPVVGAQGDVGAVGAVLIVVDNHLIPNLVDHITMEKFDIPGGRWLLNVDGGLVDLIHPEAGNLGLLFVVLDLVVHVGTQHVSL